MPQKRRAIASLTTATAGADRSSCGRKRAPVHYWNPESFEVASRDATLEPPRCSCQSARRTSSITSVFVPPGPRGGRLVRKTESTPGIAASRAFQLCVDASRLRSADIPPAAALVAIIASRALSIPRSTRAICSVLRMKSPVP